MRWRNVLLRPNPNAEASYISTPHSRQGKWALQEAMCNACVTYNGYLLCRFTSNENRLVTACNHWNNRLTCLLPQSSRSYQLVISNSKRPITKTWMKQNSLNFDSCATMALVPLPPLLPSPPNRFSCPYQMPRDGSRYPGYAPTYTQYSTPSSAQYAIWLEFEQFHNDSRQWLSTTQFRVVVFFSTCSRYYMDWLAWPNTRYRLMCNSTRPSNHLDKPQLETNRQVISNRTLNGFVQLTLWDNDKYS